MKRSIFSLRMTTPYFARVCGRCWKPQPGFRVVGEAADGEQTLKLARRLKPKILLLDIRMPKLSGLEAPA